MDVLAMRWVMWRAAWKLAEGEPALREAMVAKYWAADAGARVAEMVESMRGDDIGILVITHYSRILRYMSVDRIHVMVGGRIVRSGGPEIADQLEAEGYADLQASNA